MIGRCLECRWHRIGRCYYAPPVVVLDAIDGTTVLRCERPIVRADDGCASYAARTGADDRAERARYPERAPAPAGVTRG